MQKIFQIKCIPHVLTLLMVLVGLFAAKPSPGAGFTVAGGSSVAYAREHHTATLLANGRVLVAGGWNTVEPALAYVPETGTFVGTSDMILNRAYHTATSLPNGTVLIAGGKPKVTGSNAVVPLVEIFNPNGGGFMPRGNMIVARASHTATLLPDGKVLLAGGTDANGELASTELYDPVAGTCSATGSMISARKDHTATLLPNGKVLISGGSIGSTLLAGAELYDPATGAFSPTGNMTTARQGHTTTLLPGGKVLISGGSNGSGFLGSNELYDPVTGACTLTGNMIIGRAYHTSTLLPNGKILLTGGLSPGGVQTSAELYDPATGTCTFAGNMAAGRAYHTATLLANGQVLVYGGWNGSFLGSAELYDYVSGSFTPTGSMIAARQLSTATLLSSGKVLVSGGWDGNAYLATAELFDPPRGAFSGAGSMTVARGEHTATLLPTDKVLIAGGVGDTTLQASAELYDVVTDTFTATGSMTMPRSAHSATLLSTGTVLITGGYGANGGTAAAELYDFATGTFAATGGMVTARFGHRATLLGNGKILITGGNSNAGPLSSAELYDPATGTFTATGSMTTARYRHTATLLPSGRVLITGGVDGYGATVATAELYDPVSGAFTSTGTMTMARSAHTATLFPSGAVILAGGFTDNGDLATAERYEPATGTFIAVSAMTEPRGLHTATILTDGRVLLAGGRNSAGPVAGAERFDQGLGFDESRRPVLASLELIGNPLRLAVSGSGFRGVSEGSGGGSNSSPSNYPLLRIQRVDNEQIRPLNSWYSSSSSSSYALLSLLPAGVYRAAVVANGIPSMERLFTIAPVIGVTPASGDFGTVIAGTTTAPALFTITNNGAATLVFTAASSNAAFRVGGGTCGTFPATVTQGASCAISVDFTPAAGGQIAAELTIIANDPTTPKSIVTLSGVGIPTYPLTLAVAGNGSVSGTTTSIPATFSATGATSTVAIPEGATVTMIPNPTALSNSGFVFSGWRGACTGMGNPADRNACTFTMTAAAGVTAVFVPAPVITTAGQIPPATVKTAYKINLTATGGATPYRWLLAPGSTLPAGLTLSTAGTLGGTPSVAGDYTFSLMARDRNLVSGTATFTLNIAAAPLAVTTATLPRGTTGVSYTASLTATGGVAPYTWSIVSGALPGGLSLDTGTGLISGIPTAAATGRFTVTTIDPYGRAASKALTITVVKPGK